MRNLKLFAEDDRLRAQGGRGGEAPARRQQPDRQGASSASARSRTRSTPTRGRRSATIEDLDTVHARGLPEVLRRLLPAQQRDARRRRRRRRGRGAQAGREVLRPDAARPGAAAQRRSRSRRRREARARTLALEVQLPVVVGGYHIPRAADPDMLRARGAGGRSCRAASRRACTSAWCARTSWRSPRAASSSASRTPGLFLAFAAYLPDRDAGKVQDALLDEIARVREQPISARRAGARPRTSSRPRSSSACRPSTASRAARASTSTSTATGASSRRARARYLAVTAADVKRVARKYLVDTNLTQRDAAAGRPAAQRRARRREARSEARARVGRRGARGSRGVRVRAAAKPAGSVAIDRASSTRTTPGARRSRSAGAARRAGVLEEPHRPHQGARRRPRPAELALPKVERWTIEERPRGHRRPAQGPAGRELRHRHQGGRLRRGQGDDARRVRLHGGMLRKGTEGKKKRGADDISRAIDFVGGTLDAQAEPRELVGELLGAREGHGPVPRSALRHPAAPDVPRGRDGRGARADAGRRSRRASTTRYELARSTSTTCSSARRTRDGWVLMPEDVQKISARRSRGVLEDLLPPQQRAPRRRGRRRSRAAARRAGEGVRRLAEGRRAGARRLKMAALKATRMLHRRQARPDADDDPARPPRHPARRPRCGSR